MKRAIEFILLACLIASASGCMFPSGPSGEIVEYKLSTKNSYQGETSRTIIGYSVLKTPIDEPFKVSDGYGRIFVFRDDYFRSAGVNILFEVNGRDVALGNKGCVTWEQPVGPYTLYFKKGIVINYGISNLTHPCQIEFKVENGKYYYIEYDPYVDDLYLIGEEEGKALISEYEPINIRAKAVFAPTTDKVIGMINIRDLQKNKGTDSE